MRKELEVMWRFAEADPITINEKGIMIFYSEDKRRAQVYDLGQAKFDWEKDA